MKFKAEIKDHQIVYGNENYVRHNLSKFEGKKVIVTVEKPNNKRSLNQNGYYWKCLQIISEYTGENQDDLHRLFKGMFLTRKEVKLNGKVYSLAGSTIDLTKGQFVEYIMRIGAEAGQLGITLPSPEDYKKMLDMPVLNTKEY